MSFDAFLNQTCVIKRPLVTGVDRYNNAATAPGVVASDVRCRLTFKNMRVTDEIKAETSWVNTPLMLLPSGTDVQVGDEIYVDGEEKPWTVTAPVLNRKRAKAAHHVSAIVEKLNG